MKVLLVDDDLADLNITELTLRRLGVGFDSCFNAISALVKLSQNKYDAVILDERMPNVTGHVLAREISKKYPKVDIYLMSNFSLNYLKELIGDVPVKKFISKLGMEESLKELFHV